MLLTIDKFIRQYCVRKKEHILNPPVHDMRDFVLPKNSVLHFLEKDGTEVGILATNPLLNYQEKGKVVSEFVVGYRNDKAGGFKVVTKDIKEDVRSYFKRNKSIINGMHSKSATLQDKNLVVVNYGLMEEGVTYFKDQYAWWLRFQNRWNSIFENIAASTTGSRRNHFVIIDIPNLFPSIPQLKRFGIEDSNENVRKIANSERMIIAQFWNFFSADSKTCIPRGRVVNDKLFYIFRYEDKWLCVSMNTIMEHLKSDANPKGSYPEPRMKKNFLVMLLTMVFGNVDGVLVDGEEVENDVPATLVEEEETTPKRRETIDTTTQGTFASDPDSAPNIKEAITAALDTAIMDVESRDEYAEIEETRSRKVDKLLDQLENVNVDMVEAVEDGDTVAVVEDDKSAVVPAIDRSEVVIDYKPYQPKALDHEVLYQDKLKTYVLKGAITPQQMRRLEKMAGNYKVIPDPVTGKSTLERAAVINKEDLVISKETKFTDSINMVADESMLKSTLLDFDRKYINDVMQKDIYNSVMAVQRHGIAVQNYSVKRVKQLGDEYDVHSVKLVPIEGEPSTVTFKVPVIDDFGVFQSRSVKNRMKKQRVDRMWL